MQRAFTEWRRSNDGPSVGEKFKLLTQEAAKIASEEKPKKRKKEKETCPVCYVEIDNLSSAEYTMCPTCKRPTCNACLCKRYKTTGYDTDGYVNMTRNRSICPRCNGNIPHLKTLYEDDFELNPPVYYSDNDEDNDEDYGWRREDNSWHDGNDSDVSDSDDDRLPPAWFGR